MPSVEAVRSTRRRRESPRRRRGGTFYFARLGPGAGIELGFARRAERDVIPLSASIGKKKKAAGQQ